jgi:HD superfamily phosphodiesterase
MYSKKLLLQVKDEVRPTYKKIKIWTHGWLHVVGVVKAAKKLAEMEHVDPVLCQIAAYCHDLGRLEEEEKGLANYIPGSPSPHAEMSVAPTKVILKKIGIRGDDADDIIEAVKIHNVRKYRGKNKIALILQDADRCDGYGKLAILRFVAFNCEIDIPEPKNSKEIDKLTDKAEKILIKDSAKRQRMIETLEFVFGWRDKLANTESFKKIITEGYAYNQEVCNKLKSLK